MTAALAAYAAGRGSEHAVLAALDSARLMVPVVAVLAGEDTPEPGELRREKSSEMALPTVIGSYGRAALPAFTSAASLAAWRPGRLGPDQRRSWRCAVITHGRFVGGSASCFAG